MSVSTNQIWVGLGIAATSLIGIYLYRQYSERKSSSKDDNQEDSLTSTAPPASSLVGNNVATVQSKNAFSVKNTSAVILPDIEDAKFGFSRPMDQIKFEADPNYKYHMFICSGTSEWPAEVKNSPEPYGVVASYAKKNLPKSIQVTVCDDTSRGPEGTIDVLFFPHGKRIHVDLNNLGAFTESISLLLAESNLNFEPVVRHHIYVCAHKSRDPKCGLCGPVIYERLLKRIEQRGVKAEITVNKCSHVGGHKWAANVLVFPPGDWFGNVCPEHVDRVLDYAACKRTYGELFSVPESLKPLLRRTIAHSVPEKQ